MKHMIRQKQGYALISTLAVMVIIMALCSMLVAHSIYGRSLAKSAVVRYEQNRDYSAQGDAFVSDVRRFGDKLLEAYLAEGYTRNSADEVYKSEDGVYSRVKQAVTDVAALQVCKVTLHYRTGEGKKDASLSVCPGETLGEAAGAYALGYTDAYGYHYFIGWDCDGDGKTAEYADPAQLPVITENSDFTAVYSVGTEFTLKLLQEDGRPLLTEIPYLGGETLDAVLERAIEEQEKNEAQQEAEAQQNADAESKQTDAEAKPVPLSETLSDSRWFEMRERDVSGVLKGASLGSGENVRFFSTPEAALNASLPGDTVTLLMELTAPLIVNKAVTVRLPEGADGALDTKMILPGENYCVTQRVSGDGEDGSIRAMTFEGMVEVYTISRGETGAEQTAEYRGTLGQITDIVSSVKGEGCYSDAQGLSPGIRVLGDICLDKDYTLAVPLLPMGAVTVNLNDKKLTGSETLLQVQVQEQGAFTLLNGTLERKDDGMAAELKGGSLTLENVNVRGDITSAGAATVSMNGGSLTGSVLATGVGSLTMSGSEEEGLSVSGSVKIGGTVSARLSCCTVTGELHANSSIATELYGVTTNDGQLSGRYEEHHYVENAKSGASEAEQVEILYRPVGAEDTLWGDMTLVAMPKDTVCTTYYGANGTPIKTCLKTQDIPESESQAEPSVLWNGGTNSGWMSVSASDNQTAYSDVEKYPIFGDRAVSVPMGMGPITFSYCLGDGVPHVVRKTMQNGDNLVFAYYTPGSRTPSFFVDAQGVRVEEGSGKYQSCCADASGNRQSGLLVIPLYAQTEIRWGTEDGRPTAEAGQPAYSPGNKYVRLYQLTFLWPDGSEGKNKTEVSVPGGTKIQFVFYDEKDSGYECSTVYPLTETELEITAEDAKRGWRLEHSPESSPQLRVFCRAGLCEEWVAEWIKEYATGAPAVWEDRVFTIYGGDLFYSDADGQFCRISFCGVPKDTPVIFAYCKRGGSVLPEDSDFLTKTKDALPAFRNLEKRLREEIHAEDTENEDKALRAAMTEALADGWFYWEDREDPENRALVLLIYSDAPVTWYSMPAGMEAGTVGQGEAGTEAGTVEQGEAGMKSDAIGKICAGQTKTTRYTLCVESIPIVGQKRELLKVSVSADDFRILEWKAGA